MNTQIVHHLAHGDIAANPDVREFRGDTVVFADGSEERIDLVLFATGYEWRLPYLDEDLLPWKSGHPQLYLNVFHREIDNLYVLGFVEFADAAYKRFDEMAQLIVGDVRTTLTGGEDKERLRRLKAEHEPDLTGGMEYVDSARHANYVETHTYQHVLRELFDGFGWAWPDEEFYADLRLTPAGLTRPSSI